ncbi:MAG: DNA repair protein RecO [Halioglobus sp.]
MRVSLQPAFLLHRRPFRDTSQILEFLTPEHGRISLVAKGVRRKARGGSLGSLLQPFTPLLVSFTGRADMKTLTAVERVGTAMSLQGERLFSALYVNELLIKLLQRHDPHTPLFAHYAQTLEALSSHSAVDVSLRAFEFSLLDALGYQINPGLDAGSGDPVDPGRWYRLQDELGLVLSHEPAHPDRSRFSGSDLLRIARGDYADSAGLAAKRLSREALAIQLGGQPLRSRELFARQRRDESAGEAQ